MAALEEARPYPTPSYTSSIEHIILSNLHARHVPDVPEDVDFLMEHLNDPNYDLIQSRPPSFLSVENKDKKDAYDASEIDAKSHFDFDHYSISQAESRNSTADFDDESPYPEVRASVSSVDDPLMPVNTFRVWFLGMFFVLLSSGLTLIFSLRNPSILISGNLILILSLPLGHALAKILPTKRFRTFGYVWSLNPGPFNVKEHVCITIMASVTNIGSYSTDVVLTQRVFYGQVVPLGYQVLLAISSQIIGYALGGLLRRFVVWPSSMIWPGTLANVALMNTLHKSYGKTDRHISRQRFLVIALACSWVWYWVPGYLFTGLSVFNWVCWIAPNNPVVNVLFGTVTGLGMSVITLDWTMIAFVSSPLVTPWWAQMNIGIAFISMFWILAPILYFTNSYNFAYFPISSTFAFDNTGSPYQAKSIVTDGVFDHAKYVGYSPVFLSVAQVLAYGVNFAAFPALLVHTFLWFRKDIFRRFRLSLEDERDVHCRLMRSYPEVPMWWYVAIGVVSFALFCGSIEMVPTRLPIWAAVFGVVLSSILVLPLAILQAITNQQFPTQVMNELIAGYMLPGKPIANTLFKTISTATIIQAISFSADMKFGHYMKIPPRMMFSIQLISTVIACVWVNVIQDWMLTNIEDVCTPHQKQGFSCPSSTTFATASVIWGAVGPSRMFGIGAPYSRFLLFFPIGAIAPIPFYFLARRFPLSFWRYVNIPVFLSGLSAMPIVSGINYISWIVCGFIFNYCIRRFHFRWWMRYNYILSAALDGGVVTAMFVIFFSLQSWKRGGISLEWWGNTVWANTADANRRPFKPVPSSGIVGPSTWS